MSCILLSHVFVRSDESYKLDIIDYSVHHFRKHNKDSYIILTGHGLPPHSTTLSNCDHIYWEESIREKEINVGHPYLVNRGLLHAKEKGFSNILKMRADGVNLIDNICDYCHSILTKEKTKLLVTQMTSISPNYMGDLFMYGETNFLLKCWNIDSWYPTSSGLTSLVNNFLMATNSSKDNYGQSLKENVSIRDIYSLKWVDFRFNWNKLKNSLHDIMDNNLTNIEEFLWGNGENWIVFNKNGDVIHGHQFLNEKSWNIK